MPLKKCKYCGNIYSSSTNSSVCPNCIDMVDDAYTKVRSYLYSDPEKKDFESIIENTGVTEKALNYLIDEGWVVIDGSRFNGGKKCTTCGAAISESMLCSKCMSKLSGIFEQQGKPNSTESTSDKIKSKSFRGALPLERWRKEES